MSDVSAVALKNVLSNLQQNLDKGVLDYKDDVDKACQIAEHLDEYVSKLEDENDQLQQLLIRAYLSCEFIKMIGYKPHLRDVMDQNITQPIMSKLKELGIDESIPHKIEVIYHDGEMNIRLVEKLKGHHTELAIVEE